VIAAAAKSAGLPSALADGNRSGILLVDDWELLSSDRRAVWKSTLTAGAGSWRSLRAVVALPPGEAWPELQTIQLATPDKATATGWLAHLLPGHNAGSLLAALQHEPGADRYASLADLALLALTYPLAGLPVSRSELYEQGYALVRPLLGDERSLHPGLGPAASLRVGRALLRHYRLARGFAGGNDLEALADLSPVERGAVAPLTAGLLDDPTPVLAALWGDGAPELENLQALAACASEAPRRGSRWGLRLVERLAGPGASPEERAVLGRFAHALPAILATAGAEDTPRASAALASLHAALPESLACSLALIDDPAAPEALRWAAADLMASSAITPERLAASATTDITALKARSFVAAVGGVPLHSLLIAPPLRVGIEALLADQAAGAHRVAAAQAVVSDESLPDELRALALRACEDRDLVERSAGAASPDMRRAALETLGRGEPEEALAVVGRALAAGSAGEIARREALEVAAGLATPAATGLLARAAIDGGQSLAVRLHALDLLAGRGHGGMLVLQRLAGASGLAPLLRAAAVGHLGRLGHAESLPPIRNLLETATVPLVRRAAATALGALGRRPGLRDQVAAALITGLRRIGADTQLGERIVHALGHSSANAALTLLASLLAPSLEPALRAAWLRRIPELGHLSAGEWPKLTLADDARRALMDALADGNTTADPPNRLAELTARQAARIAIIAAGAIADLVDTRADLRAPALAALRQAVATETRSDVARATLDALGRVGYAAAELMALFDSAATPTLCWLAIERLGASEGARDALLRRLADDQDDGFLQGAIIALLGQHGHSAALPTLRRIARGAESEPHLRRAALVAMGRIATPEAAVALAAFAVDVTSPADLRAVACNALPDALSMEVRTTLRQAARSTRLPELGVALSRALARSGDHEALPALVRSAQSDHGAEAVASIEAIARLGDAGVAPLLVRISQSPTAAAGVRLAAVLALLQLCGDEFEPLLRDYLAAPAPLLRLQAYAALAALRPDDPRLGEPLLDLDAPMALRLQVLSHITSLRPDAPVLRSIVAAQGEDPQLRLAAAAALEAANDPDVALALAAVLAPAEDDTPVAPPLLRRRCALTLGILARKGGPVADAARTQLATLAADPRQPAEHAHWAAEALLGC
jgi:hypothetical protein